MHWEKVGRMPYVPDLGKKLDALLPLTKETKTLKDLAARFGLKSVSRLTDMTKGRAERGVLPDMVNEQRFNILAELVVEAAPLLGLEEARQLLEGDAASFDAALRPRIPTSLNAVLKRCDRRLTVQVLRRPDGGFGICEEACTVYDDAVEVSDGFRFWLEITARENWRLIAFAQFDKGWQVIAPGRLHSGEISAGRTIIPMRHADWLTFRSKYGQHRFVLIELPAQFKSGLPDEGEYEILPDYFVSQFARRLESPDWAGKWRWGQAVLVEQTTIGRLPLEARGM